MTKNSRGALNLVLIGIIIVGGALGWWGVKKFATPVASSAPTVQKLEQAQDKRDEATTVLRKDSQEDVHAAHIAIKSDPQPSRESKLADAFLDRAEAKTAQADGAITSERELFLQKLVDGLRSDNAQLHLEAQKSLDDRDKLSAKHSDELTAADQRVKESEKRVEIAETHDHAVALRYWTIVYGIAGLAALFVIFHVLLPVAVTIFPQLAPLADAAHDVTAEAMLFFHKARMRAASVRAAISPTST